MKDTSRQEREYHHENKGGYSFIIIGKVERRRRPPSFLFLNRSQASIIISISMLSGEFFCPYMAQPGLSWCYSNQQKGGNIS